MNRSTSTSFACVSGIVRRFARQGPDGRRRPCESGAVPPSPRGTVPAPASAALLACRIRPLSLTPTIVTAVLATLLGSGAAHAQSMEGRAREAAEAARAKSSDSEAIQRNYISPGLAGQPIGTVDSSKSFTPNLACRKTATLMEVLVQPGAGGDLATVSVARDSNLDGMIDVRSTFGVPVSGICANGVISCTPGTWNQCQAYRWNVAPDRVIKMIEAELPELAGCYCINNSCGVNLAWGNLSSVLRDLGGGMIGALTTADPRYGIAEAIIDGPFIRYVGAEISACTGAPPLPQTAYRANPSAIQGDAYLASQSSPVFRAIVASPAAVGKAELVRACTIEREVVVKSWTYDDIITASGPFEYVQSCGTDCRRYRITGNGDCSISPPTYTALFQVTEPSRILSARITRIAGDDWVQARVNDAVVGYAGKRPWLGDGLPSGDCAVKQQPINSMPIDLTAAFNAGDTRVAMRVRAGNGGLWGSVDVEVRVDTNCTLSEQVADLCSGYAADPGCRLMSEDVDGIETFRNGVATGLHPLAQTRLLGSAACPVTLDRPFFLRSRHYRCMIDSGELPKPDTSRGAYIIDHSTESILADRVRQKDGSFRTSTTGFSLPERGSVPACEAICKTRGPKANNDAAPSGVVGTLQNDPIGYDIFYHSCDSANHCPVGSDEEVVAACGCIDDFPEAVVMMQSVRLAGADLVCTRAAR
jgi:hypothetical protein